MTRVKGSSLIETLVALLIISIVIAITSAVFVNVSQSNSTYKKTIWNLRAQEWMDQSITSKDFSDDEIINGNTKFVREIIDYNDDSNLKVIKVWIEENEKSVLEVQRIVNLKQ